MRIMVCYEDNNTSRDAVRLAQKHAEVWKAEVEVVTTITREEPIKHSRLQEREDRFEVQIRELFEEVDVPFNAHLLVNSTPAGEQLVKHAARKKVDYIFMGIGKRSKVGKLLFGSTVQYLILNAPCPVLTTG